jgi:hypothetical protein
VRPELVETTHLYLKGPGDLALPVYSVSIVLFSFLRLMLSLLMPVWKWGIRKAGKAAWFGEQGYTVMYFFGGGVWGW